MPCHQPSDPHEELARRALQRHVRRSGVSAAPARSSPGPCRALLDAEIDRLPAEPKAAVVTCYLGDRSPREAAALLGWSRRKVCTRLVLGRRRLLRRLEQQGLSLSERALRRVLRAEARSGGLSVAGQTAVVLLATGCAASPGWSSRLTELVRAALEAVDQWAAE